MSFTLHTLKLYIIGRGLQWPGTYRGEWGVGGVALALRQKTTFIIFSTKISKFSHFALISTKLKCFH